MRIKKETWYTIININGKRVLRYNESFNHSNEFLVDGETIIGPYKGNLSNTQLVKKNYIREYNWKSQL